MVFGLIELMEMYFLNNYISYSNNILTNVIIIESLIVNQYGKNTLVNKVLRIYSPNKITLIKPKKLRFWLKSIALQDSDEIFDDIIENGLK